MVRSPPKLIIHIGLHKTATTYLQYHWFTGLSNVLYIHGNRFFKQWEQQVNRGDDNLLLSFEGFSGLAWNELWMQGKSNDHRWLDSFKSNILSLKQFFPKAHIIILFRHHGDLLLSMYKQYIQAGGVLDLEGFYGENGIIRPLDLSFRERIDFLRTHFDCCYFLNYEEYKKDGDDYMKNFFLAEFNIRKTTINTRGENNKNTSITGWKIECLRAINNYYQRMPRKFRSIIRYLRWSPRDILQQKFAFWKPKDPETFNILREEINQKFEQDWAYFEQHQWNYSD